MSFFRPHMGLFILDMACALTASVIDLVFPYVSRLSMTELLPNRLFETFFVVMAIMFAAYVVKGVMYYLITVLGHRMGVYIEADMRHAVFNHMQSLSFSFFDRNRTGVLMSRITSDLFEITELSHHGPEDIVISALTIIGSIAVMFTIQWKLALVLAVTLHNIPEGMAVAVPLITGGMKRGKAILITALSGAPTIIGAVIGFALGTLSPFWLSLSLSFASGAMLYVVFGELLPEAILMWRSKMPALASVIGILIGLMIIYI